jgi:hypothetical protein
MPIDNVSIVVGFVKLYYHFRVSIFNYCILAKPYIYTGF